MSTGESELATQTRRADELEKELRKIMRQLKWATLPCTNAGGRFGECACMKCPNCKLRVIVRDKTMKKPKWTS